MCDGVVVGSAIVRKIAERIPPAISEADAAHAEGLLQIREFVESN